MFDRHRVMALAQQLMDGQVETDRFYQALTQTLAEEMGCTRASLWVYCDAQLRDRIECLQLYDQADGRWSAGTVLNEADFGPYFEAMRSDWLINAWAAREHPSTTCFVEAYFGPLDIHSLLDVGIQIGGEQWGLFCCENTGFELRWSEAHVNYLRQVGTLLGFALKKARG